MIDLWLNGLQDFFLLVLDATVVDGDLLTWVCTLKSSFHSQFALFFYM